PHEKWIEQVHAAVVLRPGASADAEELTAFCRSHLAGYKIPRGFDFLDELPMSGPGKIFKRALREPYWK
ncbi:MAG: fatty-acid--CoA ligase, partial [Verrucomicrobiaceae bacterium]